MSLTSHSPGNRRNQARSVSSNSIVCNELIVRQNDRHDAGVVSIKTGREHHAIEQHGRIAVRSVQSQPLVKLKTKDLPVILRKELLHETHLAAKLEANPSLGRYKAHGCIGHAMLPTGLYIQGKPGVSGPHISDAEKPVECMIDGFRSLAGGFCGGKKFQVLDCQP